MEGEGGLLKRIDHMCYNSDNGTGAGDKTPQTV